MILDDDLELRRLRGEPDQQAGTAWCRGEDRERRMAALVADTPLKRFGLPDEVAAIAVMLASDEATYVTGAEFTIDGGLLAGSAAAPG